VPSLATIVAHMLLLRPPFDMATAAESFV